MTRPRPCAADRALSACVLPLMAGPSSPRARATRQGRAARRGWAIQPRRRGWPIEDRAPARSADVASDEGAAAERVPRRIELVRAGRQGIDDPEKRSVGASHTAAGRPEPGLSVVRACRRQGMSSSGRVVVRAFPCVPRNPARSPCVGRKQLRDQSRRRPQRCVGRKRSERATAEREPRARPGRILASGAKDRRRRRGSPVVRRSCLHVAQARLRPGCRRLAQARRATGAGHPSGYRSWIVVGAPWIAGIVPSRPAW
jgi:hypothetical protein